MKAGFGWEHGLSNLGCHRSKTRYEIMKSRTEPVQWVLDMLSRNETFYSVQMELPMLINKR